ncbi:hypothetical protein, partial [Cellulomonas sp. NPDC058312]|uniref:hypothetical protein n=1 Tax=Cellulomonas sp. NPDC058312 TaxID=3346441 RepID=UPI0036E52B69
MALGYSTVRVNVTALVIDGIDSDDLPDDTPLSGTIVLTPMVQTGRAIQYDDDGVLKLKALTEFEADLGVTGDISHRNRDYLKVVAPTAATTNMAELQWKATFKNLKYGTKSTSLDPIFFYAVPDTEINLAEHVNVAPNSTAVQLARGPRGYAVGEVVGEDGEFVFKLGDSDATEVGRVPVPELGEVPSESVGRTELTPPVRGELDVIPSLVEDPPGSGLFIWVIGDGPLARASSVYRSAASGADTSRLKLLTLGDSTNDGYGKPGGPNAWSKTWPLKLAELLRTNLGLAAGGRGWVGPSTPLAPGNYEWSPATLAPTGFALDDLTTQIGIPGSLWLQRGHASNVDEVTWTLSAGTTAVDVITTGYGGNLVITPAAGSPVTIDSTGDRTITRVTNPGATINVHGATGVGIAVLGIIEYIGDTTAGVTQWNLSRGAMAAHEYAAWLADG